MLALAAFALLATQPAPTTPTGHVGGQAVIAVGQTVLELEATATIENTGDVGTMATHVELGDPDVRVVQDDPGGRADAPGLTLTLRPPDGGQPTHAYDTEAPCDPDVCRLQIRVHAQLDAPPDRPVAVLWGVGLSVTDDVFAESRPPVFEQVLLGTQDPHGRQLDDRSDPVTRLDILAAPDDGAFDLVNLGDAPASIRMHGSEVTVDPGGWTTVHAGDVCQPSPCAGYLLGDVSSVRVAPREVLMRIRPLEIADDGSVDLSRTLLAPAAVFSVNPADRRPVPLGLAMEETASGVDVVAGEAFIDVRAGSSGDVPFVVTVRPSGERIEVPPGQTVLRTIAVPPDDVDDLELHWEIEQRARPTGPSPSVGYTVVTGRLRYPVGPLPIDAELTLWR